MTDTITTETGFTSWTWRLTSAEVEATIDKIVKINKRAASKGLTGRLDIHTERVEVEEVVGGVEFPDGTVQGGIKVTKIMWDTRVEGEAPSYNGWNFVATLDWDANAGLITRTVPGFEGQIDREALREGWCDHCQTIRNRNQTMLVEHAETGERKQVGSSCIKDFLGHSANPVKFFDDADDISDMMGGFFGGRRDPEFTPESVLAVAWAVVQEFGFVRSGDWSDVPTKGRVMDILYPPAMGVARAEALKLAERLQPHIAAAAGQAQLIREFILSDAFSGTSEYVTNLKAVVAGELVSLRNFGLICSAPQAWAKAVEKDLRRQAAKAELVNEHFGTKGDKVTLKVNIKSIRYSHGDWGTSTVYTLVTDDNHLVTWFSTSGALGDELVNDTFTLTATIKGHETWQDTKKTQITRAKVLSRVPAAA